MAKDEYADEAAQALDALDAPRERRKVQVVGRVKEGKIEIDQSSLEDFRRNFPDANVTFVAVNAPFDPVHAL